MAEQRLKPSNYYAPLGGFLNNLFGGMGEAHRESFYPDSSKQFFKKPEQKPKQPPLSNYDRTQGAGFDNYDWDANKKLSEKFEYKSDIDTSQSNNTPIVMRSHNEEYVSKKQQWGDNPNVKAAADKGFEMGQAYRAGDPLAERPDYLVPGSEAYMNRADMKVWAGANKEAAEALRNKYLQRQDRQMARSGYTRGSGEIDRGSVDAAMAGSNGGLSNGPVGSRVTFKEDPTQTWKDLTGSDTILDGQARTADLVKATQKGIAETRGYREGLGTDNDRQTMGGVNGENANVGGAMKDVTEAAITDTVDQNPGTTRGEAADILKQEVQAPKQNVSSAPPESSVDSAMEAASMQRNQAIDMTYKPDEPFAAQMVMGKRFTEPSINRGSAMLALQSPSGRQADLTGTASRASMQPPSGLNDVKTPKASLPYEQGNIHTRVDENEQLRNDFVSPERFVYEFNKDIGQRLFGQEYRPIRERPVA